MNPFTYDERDIWGRTTKRFDCVAFSIAAMGATIGVIILANLNLFSAGAKISARLVQHAF